MGTITCGFPLLSCLALSLVSQHHRSGFPLSPEIFWSRRIFLGKEWGRKEHFVNTHWVPSACLPGSSEGGRHSPDFTEVGIRRCDSRRRSWELPKLGTEHRVFRPWCSFHQNVLLFIEIVEYMIVFSEFCECLSWFPDQNTHSMRAAAKPPLTN